MSWTRLSLKKQSQITSPANEFPDSEVQSISGWFRSPVIIKVFFDLINLWICWTNEVAVD